MSRERVVQCALGWMGTPCRHRQRVKGVGVDCAQILAAVYEEAGVIAPIDLGDYPVQWHLHHERELYLECTNPACRCIFQAIAEATKVFAPSMLPEAEQTGASRGLRRGKNAGPSPVKHDPRQHSLPLHPPDTHPPGA